jgi:hypothetical protein
MVAHAGQGQGNATSQANVWIGYGEVSMRSRDACAVTIHPVLKKTGLGRAIRPRGVPTGITLALTYSEPPVRTSLSETPNWSPTWAPGNDTKPSLVVKKPSQCLKWYRHPEPPDEASISDGRADVVIMAGRKPVTLDFMSLIPGSNRAGRKHNIPSGIKDVSTSITQPGRVQTGVV